MLQGLLGHMHGWLNSGHVEILHLYIVTVKKVLVGRNNSKQQNNLFSCVFGDKAAVDRVVYKKIYADSCK